MGISIFLKELRAKLVMIHLLRFDPLQLLLIIVLVINMMYCVQNLSLLLKVYVLNQTAFHHNMLIFIGIKGLDIPLYMF